MRINFLSPIAAILFSFGSISAQYTDLINTNRPGVSQGAFSVGRNVLQVESGFSYGKEKHSLLETENTAWAWDYSVRYGFFKEELEVSLIGSFQSEKITDSRGAIPVDFKQSNFKSNTLGAKYLIFDPYRKMELKGPNLYSWKKNHRFQWADLIPAVSVYAGANFDFADNPFTPEQETTISPKFVVSTQNNWVGGFVFVTNIVVDRVTTDFPSYGYILTLTHATNAYFSIFVENQGFKSDFYADQLFRGGAAALLNENLQVDASVTLNFKDTPSLFYGRIGMAYRFDMHDKDDYIEEKSREARKKRKAEKGNKKVKKKNRSKKRKDDFIEDDGGDNGSL